MVGLWWSDSGGVVMSGPKAGAGNPHAFACRLNDFDGLRESIIFRAPPPPHPSNQAGLMALEQIRIRAKKQEEEAIVLTLD